MKIEIHATKLAEALTVVTQFAGTDKYLPNLNAIQFRVADGQLRLLTTDRYTLAEWTFHRDNVPTLDVDDSDGFLLPLDEAKTWLKHVKTIKAPLAVVLVEYEPSETNGEGKITLHGFDGLTKTVREQQGEWVPNYERLFPTEPVEMGYIGLSPDKLSQFAKALSRHKAVPLRFELHGPGKPVTVTVDGVDEYRGLIMPVRTQDDE